MLRRRQLASWRKDRPWEVKAIAKALDLQAQTKAVALLCDEIIECYLAGHANWLEDDLLGDEGKVPGH
jgi:hypothetical protein